MDRWEAKSRIMVKDGKWQIPPEERPPNWPTILPEPSNLDSIIEETESINRYRAAFSDVDKGLRESAVEMGADAGIIECAAVLCAGIWSFDTDEIVSMTGISKDRVSQIKVEIAKYPLWFYDHSVYLGMTEEDGDFPLWLIAMALNGELSMEWGDEGFKFSARSKTVS